MQKTAAKTGFDYENASGAMVDLMNEVAELDEAMNEGTTRHQQEELGDVLFSAVNVARLLHIDPEEALTRSTEKFMDRFEKVERIAAQRGMDMSKTPMDELNALWAEAKGNII